MTLCWIVPESEDGRSQVHLHLQLNDFSNIMADFDD